MMGGNTKFPVKTGKKNGNNFRIFKRDRNTFFVIKEKGAGIPPTPQPPFFTFKTTFEGTVSFSITKSGTPAIWYMGDGTIYANTNSVTHEYLVPGEKTVSVSMGDTFDNVTSIAGIIQAPNALGTRKVTEIDASQLHFLTGTFICSFNSFHTIILPSVGVSSFRLNDQQLSEETTTVIQSDQDLINSIICPRTSLNIVDLSNVNLSGTLSTFFSPDSNPTAKRILFPAINTGNLSVFSIRGLSQQIEFDLSLWTGLFTGSIGISRIGQVPTLKMPVNPVTMQGVTSLSLSELYHSTGIDNLNNGTGICPSTAISALPSSFTLDLTNWKMRNSFQCVQISSINAGQIMFPASNNNNFSVFFVRNLPNQPSLDFSGWTGVFSGSVLIHRLTAISVIMPPNINCTTFSVDLRLLNESLDLGTQIIAINTNLQNNLLSTANIDSMIDKIAANVANYPVSAKTVNFGQFVGTIGSGNQPPSAGKITLMQTIATSDNFTFTYFDGATNVVITP